MISSASVSQKVLFWTPLTVSRISSVITGITQIVLVWTKILEKFIWASELGINCKVLKQIFRNFVLKRVRLTISKPCGWVLHKRSKPFNFGLGLKLYIDWLLMIVGGAKHDDWVVKLGIKNPVIDGRRRVA